MVKIKTLSNIIAVTRTL